MDWLLAPIDFILHIDVYLRDIVAQYGALTYAVLFVVVFCETGLVIFPILPGDSLLFAAGALAALGDIGVFPVWLVLFTAAVAGDNTNYWIGRKLGPRMLSRPDSRILKPAYLDQTNEFFRKHGGKTLIMARFVPIVRTFAPFTAGVGGMRYLRFVGFSLGSALLWTGLFVPLGYFFGDLPIVEENFSLAILAIIAISLLPAVYHWAQQRRKARRVRRSASDAAE